MKKNKRINRFNTPISINLTDIQSGIVTGIMNKQAQVLAENGILSCLIPASLIPNKNALAVGDRVELSPAGGTQYRLVNILPRNTALCRGDRRSPGSHILIAANTGLVVVVVTADYLLNRAGYPEDAIIAAMRAGIGVILYVSKCDLIGEKAQALLQSRLSAYRDTFDAIFTGPDDNLADHLKGQIAVFVSDRASGKTALVQDILCRLGTKTKTPETGSIPSTHASILYSAPDGTFLIDTPGFRDFALEDVTPDELSVAYPEITALAAGCLFGNCTHTHEEGCRVIEGVRAGQIDRNRYNAYRRLTGDAPQASTQKPDYRREACTESFTCKVCGTLVLPDGAGSQHRNHCPNCLSSIHVDDTPGDRASLCRGVMDPVSVWVRKNGEWVIIHRCRECGELSSNRIAADDNPTLLMSIAVKPLATPPFPLATLGQVRE